MSSSLAKIWPKLVWGSLAVLATAWPAGPSAAQSLIDQLSAVVRLRAVIAPDARTAEGLGREREGNGIVIDQGGLVLTIGYLMVEATGIEITSLDGKTVPAQVIGYDHESGFGLVRTLVPLRVKPIPLGRSSDLKPQDPVLIAGFGGPQLAAPAFVVSRREFAGSWEYLLDDAIFTAPPYPNWSGAALIDQDGRLVGVGSLIVGNTTGKRLAIPGNMFVPIDRLKPILADLITDGRAATPPPPWLGMATEEVQGRLVVQRVTSGGPAAQVGIVPGDIVVGVGGEVPKDLADFWRKVRAKGSAGVEVPVTVIHGGGGARDFVLKSADRRDFLKLKTSY